MIIGSLLNTISFLLFFFFFFFSRSSFPENSTVFLHLSLSILSLSLLSTAPTHNYWVNANLNSWWVNLKKVKFGLMNDAFNADNTQHTHSQNHSVPKLQCKVMFPLSLSLSLSLSILFLYFCKKWVWASRNWHEWLPFYDNEKKACGRKTFIQKHFVRLYNCKDKYSSPF